MSRYRIRKKSYVPRKVKECDRVENMPSTLKIGAEKLKRDVHYVPICDSTSLWNDGRIDELRERLNEDGFVFIRGALDEMVVNKARARVMQHLLSKGVLKDDDVTRGEIGTDENGQPAVGWTFDAQTGGVSVGIDGAYNAWKALGNSTELKNVYEGDRLRALCRTLLGDEMTLQPDVTFIRMRGRGDVTVAHTDVFYFKRETDFFKENREVDNFLDDFECEVCGGRDGDVMLCELCNHGCHVECAKPRLRKSPKGEFHCERCANSQLGTYTCWVPMGDLTYDHGTLALIPGSHRLQGYTHYPPQDSGRELPLEYFPLKEHHRWEVCRVRPGDVVVFNMKTVHAASSNNTNQFRLSLDTRVVAKPILPRTPRKVDRKRKRKDDE